MHTRNGFSKYVLAGALAALASLGTAHARDTVLYAFTGGNDGGVPKAGLIEDKAGNLYGTTEEGGAACVDYGFTCGTVFKLAPDGTETVLYAFTLGTDGALPQAGLIRDKAGNLYGTTWEGSANTCDCGTVFKLAPDGTLTVLHAFAGYGEGDGAHPLAGLIQDKAGNFYGTTWQGGATCHPYGCGTVFKLAPDGTETVLHSFRITSGKDGANPYAGLIQDEAGNLYGTTAYGGIGCDRGGCGTVFKVTSNGAETVLYAFTGENGDGKNPFAGLIKDRAGNLYGTTSAGGGTGCYQSVGCGTIFKLAPDGTETVLHAFIGGSDGSDPQAGLIQDKAGNLYGTTLQGGRTYCAFGSGCGTVFKYAPDGTETVLYAFMGGNDGAEPYAGLMKGADGQLYGTTYWGGGGTSCYGSSGCGTVFALKK